MTENEKEDQIALKREIFRTLKREFKNLKKSQKKSQILTGIKSEIGDSEYERIVKMMRNGKSIYNVNNSKKYTEEEFNQLKAEASPIQLVCYKFSKSAKETYFKD